MRDTGERGDGRDRGEERRRTREGGEEEFEEWVRRQGRREWEERGEGARG